MPDRHGSAPSLERTDRRILNAGHDGKFTVHEFGYIDEVDGIYFRSEPDATVDPGDGINKSSTAKGIHQSGDIFIRDLAGISDLPKCSQAFVSVQCQVEKHPEGVPGSICNKPSSFLPTILLPILAEHSPAIPRL